MGTTATLINTLISKYEREETLEKNKESLMQKLDIFLLADRITGNEYKDLKEIIGM